MRNMYLIRLSLKTNKSSQLCTIRDLVIRVLDSYPPTQVTKRTLKTIMDKKTKYCTQTNKQCTDTLHVYEMRDFGFLYD